MWVSIGMGITIALLITIALCYIAREKCQKRQREYYVTAQLASKCHTESSAVTAVNVTISALPQTSPAQRATRTTTAISPVNLISNNHATSNAAHTKGKKKSSHYVNSFKWMTTMGYENGRSTKVKQPTTTTTTTMTSNFNNRVSASEHIPPISSSGETSFRYLNELNLMPSPAGASLQTHSTSTQALSSPSSTTPRLHQQPYLHQQQQHPYYADDIRYPTQQHLQQQLHREEQQLQQFYLHQQQSPQRHLQQYVVDDGNNNNDNRNIMDFTGIVHMGSWCTRTWG